MGCSAFAAPPVANENDPIAALANVQATNGLWGDSMKPLHLKANYQVYDLNNEIVATGVYEEWRMDSNHWKRSYTGSHYTGTEYRDSAGYGRYGDASLAYSADEPQYSGFITRAPWPEALIAEKIFYPINAYLVSYNPLSDTHYVSVDNLPDSFSCVDTQRDLSVIRKYYCFDRDSGRLRSSLVNYVTTSYGPSTQYDGRAVPTDTEMAINGHDVLKVEVTTLEPLSKMDESLLSNGRPQEDYLPPSSYLPLSVMYRTVQGQNGHRPTDFTRTAIVVVSAIKNVDGSLEKVKVVESPDPALSAAALEQLRRGEPYPPSRMNGEPVPATLTSFTTFSLPK